MLTLKKIVKNYLVDRREFPALKGLTISFRRHEFVSILGPSGCGKTTLLNIIGGLDHYSSGDLIIDGKSSKDFTTHDWDVYRNHRVGFVFQSYNLIPHQNILENVELALTIAGYDKYQKREKAKKALDKVGLKNLYYKKPNQLSGGQCQRVAIARALVNDPDILLADEPTGALDSKTSIQIMDLIKKISKNTLVIMVTHNPPLAKKYSTRIVKLLDGKIIGDSHPFHPEKEKEETKKESQDKLEHSKAKMSFWQSFKLSLKNLISKRKRTLMVIAASSIGIVGVSAVLAVSTGVKGYIATTERDMLSGNPLNASETSLDLVTLLSSLSDSLKRQAVAESIEKTGKIDIEFITGFLITQTKKGVLINNEIDKNFEEYILYGKQLGADVSGISDVFVSYGYTPENNIYTDAEIISDLEIEPGTGDVIKDGSIKCDSNIYSLSGLKNIYTGLLATIKTEENINFIPLANLAANFPYVVYQGLDNTDYLQEQYDLVSTDKFESKWPSKHYEDEAGTDNHEYECVLVLNSRKKVADLVSSLSGLISQENFMKIIFEYLKDKPDEEKIKQIAEIELDKIINKTFYYIPNGQNKYEGAYDPYYESDLLHPFIYNYRFKNNNDGTFTTIHNDERGDTTIKIGKDSGDETAVKKMKIVGIISPKEGRQYGSLSTGIYFQSDLINKMMSDATKSELYDFATDKNYWWKSEYSYLDEGTFSNSVYVENGELQFGHGLYYPMDFYSIFYDEAGRAHSLNKSKAINTYATVGEYTSILDYSQFGKEYGDTVKLSSTLYSRAHSGMKAVHKMNAKGEIEVSFDKLPYRISLYSDDFDTKKLTKAYLEKWNSSEDVTYVNSKGETITLTADERTPINVPDNLTIVISMINNLITTTTVSLTIFASLSLVVSSVMIGIITYISVMERIKEIGVIRSLGGRKKDVSHLFNAEAFILGLASGIFGIVITYIFELILDVSIYAVFKIPMIANLNWYTAIIMIVLSIVLTAISGLIPARSAAKKDPVTALRSE